MKINVQRHIRQLRQALGIGAVLLVAGFGAVLGHYSYRAHLDAGMLSMGGLNIFRPAVLFAAGRGMIVPESLDVPELEEFLSGAFHDFNPDLLPPTIAGRHLLRSTTESFALTHWALYYALGWCWRLFGINHEAPAMLCALLSAIAALALYRLFRLAARPLFAVVGVFTTLTTPAWLLTLPEIRDFGKAPLMLLFIALAGVMLNRRRWFDALFFWAVLLGAFLGLGYGFRQDMLICVLPAVLLFFAAPLYESGHLLKRLCATLLFCCVFLLCAAPVLIGMRHDSGSVSTHTLFQGLSQCAEQTMGFGDAAYDLLLTPSDPEVHAVVNAHARRRGVEDPMDLYLSPAYGASGRALFLEWARQFPADLFHRGLASMEAVTRLVSLGAAHPHYDFLLAKPWFQFLAPLHNAYIQYIERFRLVLIVNAVLLLAMRSRKAALLALLLFGYFMAYPSLLFQLRHTFHLAFVTPLAALFLMERACRASWTLLNPTRRRRLVVEAGKTRQALGTSVLFMTTLCICAGVLSIALSVYQNRSVDALMRRYRDAELTPVTLAAHDDGHTVLFMPERPLPGLEDSWNMPLGDAATAYLALEFEPSDYAVPVAIVYHPIEGADFSHTQVVPPATTVTRIYTPIYELANFVPEDFTRLKFRFPDSPLVNLLIHRQGTTRFQGIRLAAGDAPLLRRAYSVEHPETLPWLLHLRLSIPAGTEITRKSTYLKKKLAALPLEIRLFADGDVTRAVEKYFALATRFPGHEAYQRRLRTLIGALPDDTTKIPWLYRLGRLAPRLAGTMAAKASDIGVALLEQQDVDGAQAAFRRAMELAPDDLWHCVRLGDALAAAADFDAARDIYTEVLRTAPESPYAAHRLDNIYKRLDASERRVTTWREIQALWPDAAVPALHLGKALEEQNHLKEALALYQNTGTVHPDSARLILRKGIVLAIIEGYAKGRALMDQALERDATLLHEMVDGLTHIAMHYTGEGAYAFAEAIILEIIDLEPENGWHRVRHGELLMYSGDYEAALRVFKEVLLMAPESPYSADKLALILDRLDCLDRRVAVWRAIHERAPKALIPALYLGATLEDLDQLDEALALYRRMGEKHPDDPRLLLRLGVLVAMLEEYERGRALMDAALSRVPTLQADFLNGLSRIAGHLADHSDYTLAAAIHHEAMKLDPEDGWRKVRYGEALIALEDYDAALHVFNEVLATAPESPYCADKLALVLERLGYQDRRVAVWRAIHERAPKALIPALYLGAALEDLDQLDEALALYRRMGEKHPDDPRLLLRLGALVAIREAYDRGRALMDAALSEEAALRAEFVDGLARIARHLTDTNNFQQAGKLYQELLVLDPGEGWHKVRYSEVLASIGEYETALDILGELLESNPESPYSAALADRIYDKMDRTEQRLTFWRAFSENAPEAVIPRFHFGLALEALGRHDEAREAYRAVLKANSLYKDEAAASLKRLETPLPAP